MCGGVDGQITQTHEAQGLGKNAFRCDFIGSLLSHSHSNERKEQIEVEDEMRILQQSLENDGWGGKLEREMSLNGKSCPQDLQDRGGIWMDLYEYCMI